MDQAGIAQGVAPYLAGLGDLGLDVFFAAKEDLEKAFPVELEASHILFYVPGDAVNSHEESQLAIAERIKQLVVVGGYAEDALTIGDQLHLRKMTLHGAVAAQIVPGSPHTLHRHAVVEKPAHDPKSHEIAKTVKPSDPWTAACALNGRLDQRNPIPIPELVRGAPRQLGCLLCGEGLLHVFPQTSQPDGTAREVPPPALSASPHGGARSGLNLIPPGVGTLAAVAEVRRRS